MSQDIKDNEKQLFIEAMKGVRPIAHKKIKTLANSPNLHKKLVIRQKGQEENLLKDSQLPIYEELNEVTAEQNISFQRNGVQPRQMKNLRKGLYPIEATLDLHQCTLDKAANQLEDFIDSAVLSNLRTVLIVHGKGLHSQNQMARLKNHVVKWLPQMQCVLAFCSASPRDGGAGALYVRLANQHLQDLR